MNRLKNIVVGIDFTSNCESALEQAIRIARWNNASLHVVHVIDELVVEDYQDAYGGSAEQISQEICQTSEKRLGELIDGKDTHELSTHVSAVIGHPFQDLLRAVKDASADLLVLGAHGSSEPGESAGTLATKCIRKVPTRIMLVRAPHSGAFAKIVACIDFSEPSANALEQAIRVAQRDKAKLEIVHVFTPPWTHLHYRAPTPESSPDFANQYMEALEGRMSAFLDRFKADLSECETDHHLIESGYTATGITEFAESSNADLVVLATRGRTTLKELLMGTTAEKIVRESLCSILAVKPLDFVYKID